MDAFEELAAQIFESQGYWVLRGFRVALTKAEKRSIGNPSVPRWPIDLVIYKAGEKNALAVECKSYIDSPGVRLSSIRRRTASGRYKLFTKAKLSKVILGLGAKQLRDKGLLPKGVGLTLALATPRLAEERRSKVSVHDGLEAYFVERGWKLFGPKYIKGVLKAWVNEPYEDSVAMMVAKILGRE
jgi:hypothetical protein